MAIESIPSSAASAGRVGAAGRAAAASTEAAAAAGSFSDSLAGFLATVNESAGDANTAVADMIQGKGDVHEAMIAMQRAETTLQLTVQIRNKLVQAYQDVMRMPI